MADLGLSKDRVSSMCLSQLSLLPVAPPKAMVEVSKIGHYRRGELLWCMDGRAIHWWTVMDRKVVGVVLFGVVAMLYVYLYISVYLFVVLFIYLSIYLQVWKRSYSARLPQFLNLTTSKTKQFCETASNFKLDNIKNETSLWDFLKFRSWQHQKRNNSTRLPSKMESWVQSWWTRTN